MEDDAYELFYTECNFEKTRWCAMTEQTSALIESYQQTLQMGAVGALIMVLVVMLGGLVVAWRIVVSFGKSSDALARTLELISGQYQTLSTAIDANTTQDRSGSKETVAALQALTTIVDDERSILTGMRTDLQGLAGLHTKLAALETIFDEIRDALTHLVKGPISAEDHRAFVNNKLTLIEAQVNVLIDEINTTKREVLEAVRQVQSSPQQSVIETSTGDTP